MKQQHPITQKLRSRKRVAEQGFSIVESVVAGVLLAAVMGGVSRLSVSALASSSNQSERARIEAAINDNIQLLQMEDSYLRLEEMGSQSQQDAACSNPTSHLKAHLEAIRNARCHRLIQAEPLSRSSEAWKFSMKQESTSWWRDTNSFPLSIEAKAMPLNDGNTERWNSTPTFQQNVTQQSAKQSRQKQRIHSH